ARSRLQPSPAGLRGANPADAAKLREQDLLRAPAMPVVVVGAADAAHVMDDDVVGADLDRAVAPRAPVQLARDVPDQPRLVALVGQPAKAVAGVGEAVEVAHPLQTRLPSCGA